MSDYMYQRKNDTTTNSSGYLCTSGSSMKHESGGVLCVRFNHSCDYVLSCGRDKTIRLWNPLSGVLINTYRYASVEIEKRNKQHRKTYYTLI